MSTALGPVRARETAPPPLVHLAAKWDPDRARCGTPRDGRPFKPGATPTCVVCIELARGPR